MQSSKYPGLNPNGYASWLTEPNLLGQAEALATTLKPYGYTYVNIDAGWQSKWNWDREYDGHGRPRADSIRFPHGMAYVARRIHSLGLKAGIYLTVGLDRQLYQRSNDPIAGAPGCRTHDIVYPDLRKTNGWNSSYKIDFEKPCAQAYVDSVAKLLADWGYDLLKLDGVGPGSYRTDPDHDNRSDVKAWHDAFAKTGRPVQLVLSWALDPSAIDAWQRYSDGWRIDKDVECYCKTLVRWDKSIALRFDDAPRWVDLGGPKGWNNFDSLDVGNGVMDGITDDERRSYMTLWAISATPLYTGDDLTRLDPLGRQLLTNRDVLAINAAGRAASPVKAGGTTQVWRVQNADGTWTVALFNLGPRTAAVTARWSDIGFADPATVHDVWSDTALGERADGFTADVPSHGTRLLRVDPR